MRFNLTLAANRFSEISINYQYPFSSAIYKIIQRADSTFSAFLHNTGYGNGYKSFKLFTFSDINTPFKITGDRLQMMTDTASISLCFYMPQAAENFIKGLFMHQQLEIADKKSKTSFTVQQVESKGRDTLIDKHSITVQPLSPIVTGRKNVRGYYDYRAPYDANFTDCLLHNWIEKYKAVHNISEDEIENIKEQTTIQVKPQNYPPKQLLITIKQGTTEETRVRSYTKFQLQLSAPEAMLQLVLDCGLGLYNSMGLGCIE